jgi:hypothetical protein
VKNLNQQKANEESVADIINNNIEGNSSDKLSKIKRKSFESKSKNNSRNAKKFIKTLHNNEINDKWILILMKTRRRRRKLQRNPILRQKNSNVIFLIVEKYIDLKSV